MAKNISVTYLLRTAQDSDIGGLPLTESATWADVTCPHCGHQHALVVAAQVDGNYQQQPQLTAWYRCVACQAGYVREAGVVYPGGKPLRTPQGVPADEVKVWEEARDCLGVGANTAAVMLCRKLLFHVAVTHGLAPANSKGFAPGFAECAEYLQGHGLVTPKMMKWVERIKEVGNDANHKLVPITAEQARDVATFTEQLLVLAYELDVRMDAAASTADVPSDAAGGAPDAG